MFASGRAASVHEHEFGIVLELPALQTLRTWPQAAATKLLFCGRPCVAHHGLFFVFFHHGLWLV